ncbi:MAG: hypothetical protein J6Y00_03150 [Paludibacteraceae bacterium]|nr:hypothetical protein [Paludibacteraceae bacterium]
MKKTITSILSAVCMVTALQAQESVNPYISRVFEYRPAPGQFINTLPASEAGDTEETMAQKAEECLADDKQVMISLGGYGGYVVFGFDHEVLNVAGEYDMKILGNGFYSATQKEDEPLGGSSEPGIVMVSRDDNGNGLPDDEWYELAGSEETNEKTLFNYSITYYRPNDDTPAETYIRWEDSEGVTGYIPKNSFHKQAYYPEWIAEDEMTFTGTRLRDNGIDLSGKGTNYVLYCFDWGYADNHPNEVKDHPERHVSEFDLSWAVDKNRQPVHLEGIHFVKVYNAMNQVCGWLGETSTEVMGAYDLHPEAKTPTALEESRNANSPQLRKEVRNGRMVIIRNGERYTLTGQRD